MRVGRERIVKIDKPVCSGAGALTEIPQTTTPKVVAAKPSDGNSLAELRAQAMRPSLEAIGRFDIDRARRRFLDRFQPAQTWKLLDDEDVLVGFFVLKDLEDHLYLDHLYVRPGMQGMGFGACVIRHAKTLACKRAFPIRLVALKESPANGFYRKHGFRLIGSDELDNRYEWSSGTFSETETEAGDRQTSDGQGIAKEGS